MTEVRDNPYIDSETYTRPRKWVLQSRADMSKPFTPTMDVPREEVETYTLRIDRLNAVAGYRKYRIVSR